MKIVLLPGLDGTGELFKPLIDVLPDEFETLVISYSPENNQNYEELTELVLSQLPKEKFILLAESFSGPIAYQVAIRHPTHLQSVVFVATFLECPRPFLLTLSRFLPMRFLFSLSMPKFLMRAFLFGSAMNNQLIKAFQQSIKQVSPSVLSFRLQEISKLSSVHISCGIKAIYLQATNDQLVPSKCLESFRTVFDNISLFSIEGSHLLLQSNPLACAKIIVNKTV